MIHGHEVEQNPQYGKGQLSLVCSHPWLAELDLTERLSKNNSNCYIGVGWGGHK